MGFNVKEECVMTCKWGEKKNMVVLLAVGLVLLIGGVVFNLVLPEDAHVEMAEGRITLVRGDSRVVAMVISRVPDEDPAAALPILMQDFDPKTSETMDFDAQPGFCILGGVVNDAFDDGEDKITLMVLADSGELLILSGYNLARDHHALYLFLTELLENASMDGAAVYVAEDAAAAASPEV